MEKVFAAIDQLVEYGVKNLLLEEADRVYTRNRLLEKLKLDYYEESRNDEDSIPPLEEILKVLLDYAAEAGLLQENTTTWRDLFDTELMGCLTGRPGEIIGKFNSLYRISPQKATDYYYAFSRATDYIRTYRVARDIKWTADTEYGQMIITINLSKPEKDPKAIAAALSASQTAYPKCQLCLENEGYAGRINHPARANHRIIPITVSNSPWFLQYSPYVYYNEHCIVFNSEHIPMKIDHSAFEKLLDFVRQFPHYCVGSNADLPIVGGSILTHEHFQGGCFEFPMQKAGIDQNITVSGYEDIEAGIVKWPMSVIRIASEDEKRLADCADRILECWRSYSDEEAFIFSETDGIPHNTITPIARKAEGRYILDLVLRNNITTDEHPLGVFHPHAEHHHIKKENIGLIEVMGLAILPSRLKKELTEVEKYLVNLAGENSMSGMTGDKSTVSRDKTDKGTITKISISDSDGGLTGISDSDGGMTGISDSDGGLTEELEKHIPWIEKIVGKYAAEEYSDAEGARRVIEKETGLLFTEILEQCGVFKRTAQGRKQFLKFIESI